MSSPDNLKSQFFDQAEVAFLLFDKELNLIDVNEMFLTTTQLSRDKIIGKNIIEISPDIISSGLYELYKEVIRSGKTLVLDEVKPHPSFGNFYSRIKAFKVGGGLGIVSKNITDLKESIERYYASEEKLTKIIETTDEMMHQLSLDGVIVWVNESWKKQMGFAGEEVIGKKLLEFIDESTRAELEKVMTLLMKGIKVDNLSCTFISKNGGYLYLEGQTIPIYSAGKITGSHAFLRNVSRLKKAEQERNRLNSSLEQLVNERTMALRTSELALRESQKIAGMGNWEWDLASNNTRWSENLFRIYGFDLDEVTPSFEYFLSRVHPDDIRMVEEANSKLMSEMKPVELEIRLQFPGNTCRWILNRIVPVVEDGRLTGLKGINIDITERKKAEDTIRKSIKEISDYKFALDESSIIAITDQKGIIKEVNDNFCKISKYKREELIGQDHRIVNSGFHPKEFIRGLWTTIAKGKIWKGEIKNKAKDDSTYWVDTTIVPFLSEFGKPYQYLAIRADITSRKISEEALLKLNNELEQMVEDKTKDVREKEAQYHLLLDTMREGVLFVNNNDEILYANRRFCEMTGYAEKELIGEKANEIFLGEDYREKIKNVNSDRKNRLKGSYEIPITIKSGRKIWVNINGSPVIDEQGSVIGSVGTHSDITALKLYTKNLEEIIFSLSHKVRQPVAHIIGVSNLLDSKMITSEELNKICGYMKESALNLDKFTRELTELVTAAKSNTENK